MEALIATVAVIAALIAALLFGRKAGADSVERKNQGEVIDAVKQAKQVSERACRDNKHASKGS